MFSYLSLRVLEADSVLLSLSLHVANNRLMS